MTNLLLFIHTGQALGGVFAAVANIISIFMAANDLTSALIYFILGSVSLFISFILVLILPKLIFYKFHSGEKGIYRWVENYPPEALIRPEPTKPNSWVVLKKVSFALMKVLNYILNTISQVWIPTAAQVATFLVTLAGFPALIVLVVSDTAPSKWNGEELVICLSIFFNCTLSIPVMKAFFSLFPDKYFVPVVSFFVFAFGDYIGRITSGIVHWVRR